jgi:ABC-type transporter Mla subunit MlaD
VLPQLQDDISKLADFADTYDAAADDLLAVLDNLSVTNQTVVDQAEQLRRTFTVVDASSNVTGGFLETNEQNLISLAQTSRPVLGVFAKYSPEYPCLLNGLTRFNPMISEAFGADGDPALNLNITVSLPPRNPYVPGDQPAYIDTSGPDCRGLTDIDALIAAAQQNEFYCPDAPADGVDSTDNPTTGNPNCLGGRGPDDVPPGAGDPNAGNSLPYNLAGSTAELDFVRNILAYQTGLEPGRVSDLAASTMAPLLRGTQVMLR